MNPARPLRLSASPAPWSCAVPGSFAQRTLAVRVPKIFEDTIEANGDRFSDDVRSACFALYAELTQGRLRGLMEDAADRVAWDAACAPHIGKRWLELPWYFAESYFYRRVLEATAYFSQGTPDPFLVLKQEEERAMLPRVLSARRTNDLEELVCLALWGNRVDLSYTAGRAFGALGDDDDLLVDQRSLALLRLAHAQRVAFVLDNAGTELAFDLLLAAQLTRSGKHVTLHAKAQPTFVSDATIDDVKRTIALLDLPEHFAMAAHAHWTSSAFHTRRDIPFDLASDLASADVVIIKGDANYRRLVGDAPWPHDTPVEEAMDFPAPLIALRTCKAEVAVGVSQGIAARARARDAQWLVNGRLGMIQVAGAPLKANGP